MTSKHRKKIKEALEAEGWKVEYHKQLLKTEDEGVYRYGECNLESMTIKIHGVRGDKYDMTLVHEWIHTMYPDLHKKGGWARNLVHTVLCGMDPEEYVAELSTAVIMDHIGIGKQVVANKFMDEESFKKFEFGAPSFVVDEVKRRTRKARKVLKGE